MKLTKLATMKLVLIVLCAAHFVDCYSRTEIVPPHMQEIYEELAADDIDISDAKYDLKPFSDKKLRKLSIKVMPKKQQQQYASNDEDDENNQHYGQQQQQQQPQMPEFRISDFRAPEPDPPAYDPEIQYNEFGQRLETPLYNRSVVDNMLLDGTLVEASTPEGRMLIRSMAAIYRPAAPVTMKGVGTFITKKHLITAADIVYNMNTVHVKIGDQLQQSNQLIISKRIVLHPLFVISSPEHNLAIVELPMQVPTIAPVGIAIDTYQYPNAGHETILASYGMVTKGEFVTTSMPHTIQHTIVEAASCDLTNNVFLCTMDTVNTTAPCNYDMGAPLLDRRTSALLALVTNFQHNCNPMFGKSHTRVSLYLSWILMETQSLTLKTDDD